jgi:transposase-like protein
MTSKNTPGIDPAARPKRRTFGAEYKLRIVAEYDAAPKGEKGAVLRRERLYDSHVKEWRAARDAGALDGLTDRRTAGVRPKRSAAEVENGRLKHRIERLEQELAKRDAALELLGKANALLALVSESAD